MIGVVIRETAQVEPFAGQFVAYESNNSYFGGCLENSSDYYQIDPTIDTNYGYVEDYRTFTHKVGDYTLERCKHLTTLSATSALITEKFDEFGPVCMRFATISEIVNLRRAFNEEEMSFDYMDFWLLKESMLRIFDDAIEAQFALLKKIS